ncbi:MAG TPA: RcnB family protein [Caulobacteraceae bacterium]
MKTPMKAALALSLLAGTTLAAQPAAAQLRSHEVIEQQRQEIAKRKEEKRQAREERREAREERRDEKPAAAPQRSERAVQALKLARERNAERAEVRQDRREDRVERREDGRENRVERREDRREDRREQVQERRTEQRVQLNQQARRAEVLRRLRLAERQQHHYRPGAGHRLRDRDRNRGWYDYNRYQRSYWATQRYRAPWYQPSGWSFRTFVFGDTYPTSWFGQNRYLDWWRYQLPRPPIGAEWVRNRDDALLVDVWSGRVLAVYYDLFW